MADSATAAAYGTFVSTPRSQSATHNATCASKVPHLNPSDRQNIENIMQRNGVCPHQVHSLSQSFSPSALTNLSTTPQRQADHTSCLTSTSCMAFNVDMSAYTTRHRTPNCTCGSLSVDTKALTSLIEKGDVPLVSFVLSDSPGKETRLRVSKRRPWTGYVAVSHIWADGLGNPGANALPKCQVEWIAKRVGDVMGRTDYPIWLDTLLIPVSPSYAHLRTLAIDSMASIYAGASLVLVLDANLMRTPALAPEQCLAQIACSAWMCRCWTLQEGVLAAACGFVFNGATVIAKLRKTSNRLRWSIVEQLTGCEGPATRERWSRFEQDGRWLIPPFLTEKQRDEEAQEQSKFLEASSEWLFNELNAYFADFFGMDRCWQNPHERFVNVWNALSGRSTTKPEDLFLILANLLGFSPQQVQDMPSDNRLPAMIARLEYIPFSLFLQEGPKLDTGSSGCKSWIPTELGRERLRLNPLLFHSRLEPGTLRFTKATPWSEYLDIHIFDNVYPALVPPSIQITTQNGVSHVFSLPSMTILSSITVPIHGICVILFKDPVTIVHNRIAIFLITEHVKTHYDQRLTIHYLTTVPSNDFSLSPFNSPTRATALDPTARITIALPPSPPLPTLTCATDTSSFYKFLETHARLYGKINIAIGICLVESLLLALWYVTKYGMRGTWLLVVVGLVIIGWACVGTVVEGLVRWRWVRGRAVVRRGYGDC